MRGKALCREAARLAAELGEAELAARAALTYGEVFTFALVDPVLVDLLEEALAALPPGDSPLRVRLLARLAAASSRHRRRPSRCGWRAKRSPSARRLNDPPTLLEALHAAMAAMMDVVHPRERLALNLEIEQLATSRATGRSSCARTAGWRWTIWDERAGSGRCPHRRLRGDGARAGRALGAVAGAAAPIDAGQHARAVRRGRGVHRRGPTDLGREVARSRRPSAA